MCDNSFFEFFFDFPMSFIFQTTNVGSLSLVGSNQAIAQNIAVGQPLLCRVNFPLQNPLATIKLITVNDQSICVGADGK
jgi:Serine protease gd N-terminus